MRSRAILAWVALALLAVALLAAGTARALDVPELTGRVVDRADLLDPAAEARVSDLLAAHEKATGQQFALLTLPTLGGEPIEPFSMRVVEKWQLGGKEKDDGLLLLVVSGDRKMRIEVGYGLEGDVPDAFASRIIRNVLAPAFRSGDYAPGIERAFRALMEAATGQSPAQPEAGARPEPRSVGFPAPFAIPLLLLLAIFVLPAFLGSRRRRGGIFFGGGGGFGGGGFGGGGGGFSGGGGGFGGGGSSGGW